MHRMWEHESIYPTYLPESSLSRVLSFICAKMYLWGYIWKRADSILCILAMATLSTLDFWLTTANLKSKSTHVMDLENLGNRMTIITKDLCCQIACKVTVRSPVMTHHQKPQSVLIVTNKFEVQQYWTGNGTYRPVSVQEFAEKFKEFQVGRATADHLKKPYDKSTSHPRALIKTNYALPSDYFLLFGFVIILLYLLACVIWTNYCQE